MRFRFIFICIFAAVSSLFAQRTFTTGVVFGVNGSQIHGDTYSGFNQAGLMGGAFVQTNPDEAWRFQFGIQYSRKGSKHIFRQDQTVYEDFELRLNYVEVPLLIRYNTRKVFFDFGGSIGYMFKEREWDANGERIPPQPIKHMEYAMVIGIGYNFNDAFYMEFSSSNSLIPIKKFPQPIYYQRWFLDLFNKGMYNNLVTLNLGYRFGGKKSDD